MLNFLESFFCFLLFLHATWLKAKQFFLPRNKSLGSGLRIFSISLLFVLLLPSFLLSTGKNEAFETLDVSSQHTSKIVDDGQLLIPVDQEVAHVKKFKLGFEFQESSTLCPWAYNNFNLQKNPLFLLKNQSGTQKLWHVEIDTDDIEFVTRAFTSFEREELEVCITSIVEAMNHLQRLLVQDISFRNWLESLEASFPGRIERCKDDFDWDSTQTGIKKPDVEEWVPIFSPQATIQHPLEDTIFLYFGLFGFKSFTTVKFTQSLPYRSAFKEAHSEADIPALEDVTERFRSKFGGLLFLQALTLIYMTPIDEDASDSELLQETKDMFDKTKQVDPKSRLPIMSRRSFSEMFSAANLFPPNVQITPSFFVNGFISALEMSRVTGLPNHFYKANYAEQFFDDAGRVLNLTHLHGCFKPKFVLDNKALLLELLENGIVSTAMLRNLSPDFDIISKPVVSHLNSPLAYFFSTVGSIVNPTHHYRLDPYGGTLDSPPLFVEEESQKDNLSPPWFLDSDNSMGGFQEEVDLSYGDAIVEVRAIREVGSWFLKTMECKGRLSGFLGTIDETLVKDTLYLFDFLTRFRHHMHDDAIKLGITHAVYEYKW